MEFLHADVFFEDTVDEKTSVGRIVAKFLCEPLHELRGHALYKTHIEKATKGLAVNVQGGDVLCLSNDSTQHPIKLSSPEETSSNFNKVMNEITSTADKVLNLSAKSDSSIFSNVTNDIIHATDMTLNHFCEDKSSAASRSSARDISIIDTLPSAAPEQLTPDQLQQMMLYQSAGLGGLAVLCKNEGFDDNEKYRMFDTSESLKDNLIGLRVVEHPVLIVVKKDHVYEFLSQYNRREDPELERILQSQNTTCGKTVQGKKVINFFDSEFCDDDYMEESHDL